MSSSGGLIYCLIYCCTPYPTQVVYAVVSINTCALVCLNYQCERIARCTFPTNYTDSFGSQLCLWATQHWQAFATGWPTFWTSSKSALSNPETLQRRSIIQDSKHQACQVRLQQSKRAVCLLGEVTPLYQPQCYSYAPEKLENAILLGGPITVAVVFLGRGTLSQGVGHAPTQRLCCKYNIDSMQEH